VIRLPRRVCMVVTSKRSGFCPESLIFGIGRLLYVEMAARRRKKVELSYQQCDHFNVFGTGAKVHITISIHVADSNTIQ